MPADPFRNWAKPPARASWVPEPKNALIGVDLTTRMACIFMKVGEPELALKLLEHSLSVPAGAHVGELRVAPRWDPLRNKPRFQLLLAKYAPRE